MRAPSKTVKTGAAAGAMSLILVWVIGTIWPTLDIPGEVAAAFTVVLSSVSAWIVRDPQKGDAKH